MLPEGAEAPKAADFVNWTELIVAHVASGSSAEELRGTFAQLRKAPGSRVQWSLPFVTLSRTGPDRSAPFEHDAAHSSRQSASAHQRKQGLPAQYWHHDGARFNADVTMRDLSWRRERLHGDEVDDLRMPAWPRIKCR